jgi:hypothetical protein
MPWDVKKLNRSAVAISASRRTDIPGLFPRWFENRLTAGFVEYIARIGRVQKNIRPEDVTHFNFWTKWPHPFRKTLDRVCEIGYPTLWNVTVTGLGQTAVEPYVPRAEKVVASIRNLSQTVSPKAIQWRYDPIFLSEQYSATFHVKNFRILAERLAGSVDRVAVSFVEPYGRRVTPDLKRYERETGDRFVDTTLAQRVDLIGELGAIAAGLDLELTICCSPELRKQTGYKVSGCNSFAWACRVYPELRSFRRLRNKPTRPDCACSEEWDIGVYDTCIFGCAYSYGSCSFAKAMANFRRRDPDDPCLLPHAQVDTVGKEQPTTRLTVQGREVGRRALR